MAMSYRCPYQRNFKSIMNEGKKVIRIAPVRAETAADHSLLNMKRQIIIPRPVNMPDHHS